MPTYLYRPEHPLASKNGFILKENYLEFEYYNKDNKQMMKGNKPVSFYFNSDTMEPLKHMASGKMISSKKKFRDETKAYGCIEVGNDTKVAPRKQIKPDKRQRRDDIKKAIYQLRNGK